MTSTSTNAAAEMAGGEHGQATAMPMSHDTLHSVALGARIALFPAALLAIVAAFVNRPLDGALIEVGTVLGALGLATLAALSLHSPRPKADLGAVMLAMLLAGGQALQGFGLVAGGYFSTAYALPIIAWLTLFGGGLALAATLPLGAKSVGQARVPKAASGFARGWPEPAGAANSPASGGSFGAQKAASTNAAAGPANASGPGAGWYPAPDGKTARWWDGSAWTDQRRELSELDAASAGTATSDG